MKTLRSLKVVWFSLQVFEFYSTPMRWERIASDSQWHWRQPSTFLFNRFGAVENKCGRNQQEIQRSLTIGVDSTRKKFNFRSGKKVSRKSVLFRQDARWPTKPQKNRNKRNEPALAHKNTRKTFKRNIKKMHSSWPLIQIGTVQCFWWSVVDHKNQNWGRFGAGKGNRDFSAAF